MGAYIQLEHDYHLQRGTQWCSYCYCLDHEVASVTQHDRQRLASPLTCGASAIAAVGIDEARGNGESMTVKEGIFSPRVDGGRSESSRRNKAYVGAGTTSDTIRRWVRQGRLDQSATLPVVAASS